MSKNATCQSYGLHCKAYDHQLLYPKSSRLIIIYNLIPILNQFILPANDFKQVFKRLRYSTYSKSGLSAMTNNGVFPLSFCILQYSKSFRKFSFSPGTFTILSASTMINLFSTQMPYLPKYPSYKTRRPWQFHILLQGNPPKSIVLM